MWKVNLRDERTGVIGKNNYGSLMEVVTYNKVKDIWVKFLEHGNLVHTSWTHFANGNVANPYDRTLYGIGYLGEGKYKTWVIDKQSPQYATWTNMMTRCYSEKEHKRNPKYKDCRATIEWHNFQNFAAWYDENFYEVKGNMMCLDKDILVKGNKIYSPKTCIFVPMRINTLFTKRDSKRGQFPIGVTKVNKKYRAHCSNILEISENLGLYDTVEEAFNVYKVHKEKYIKEVANDYKDKIPENLYNTMINYKVDFDD